MRLIDSPENSRNYGFWNEAEQEALMSSHVAIAGVGGDGFQLGVKLAMMGVQEFSIADPEVFEPENTNRVPGATTDSYGRNKAEVFKDEVLKRNPDAKVNVYTDGVTKDNIYDFMDGATIAFDESELRYLHVGTMVAREARRRGIPDILVMNVGFAALVTSFHPYKGQTFEEMMGIPKNMPIDLVAEREVDLSRCLPYLPKYGDLQTLTAVEKGAPLPSIAQGVDVASAIGSTQAFLHITKDVGNKRPEPVWAPRFAWMDAYTMKGGTTGNAQVSYYRHAIHMAVRNFMKQNPLASYQDAQREAREQSFAARQEA